jgi:hypothetical protein
MMTVIAWDGKILAADRQGTVGDTIYTIQKLFPLSHGGAMATTGHADSAAVMRQWWSDGANKKLWPACQSDKDKWSCLIIARPNKPVLSYETLPEPLVGVDCLAAWGIGREAALGAMAMGADAIKAVEIASRIVIGCGRGCDFIEVNK